MIELPVDGTQPWYHGSPAVLEVLREGSTITQWRQLAEAFSHKPTRLEYGEIGGEIIRNGTEHGIMYVVDEPIVAGVDVYPHPRTTMDMGVEWLTARPLRLRRVHNIEEEHIMSFTTEYRRWLASEVLTADEHAELVAIEGDQKEIESRFYAPLSFGTAGLRGTMAVGLNRMNVYVVRQVTQAMAELVLAEDGASRGVVVGYDCRNNSALFAREAARVLAANGIKVMLFSALCPTPLVSFAILRYNAIAGINVTASHNPKEYNGYKAYWQDGAQLPPEHANTVEGAVSGIDVLGGAKVCDFDAAVADGLVTMLGDKTDEEFLKCVLGEAIDPQPTQRMGGQFKLVYTPFHGAGYKLVPEALKRAGFSSVFPVPEQMVVDGNFPTVVSPNPENPEGFALAVALAKKHDAQLIVGTDPDSDRMGLMARDAAGDYVVLSGNQTGALMLDYIISARKRTGKMPSNPFAVKTIVSSEMTRAICDANGVDMYDTFTGFKFIAERINACEADGGNCIFSYEESFGYLLGGFCRDKDAVTASLIAAEMAVYHAERGMTLCDALDELYQRIGFYSEATINKVYPGLDGIAKMDGIMESFRSGAVRMDGVTESVDYLTGIVSRADGSTVQIDLKDANVLEYRFGDGSKLLVRPSGTEPKIKFYVLARGQTADDAERTRAALEAYVEQHG